MQTFTKISYAPATLRKMVPSLFTTHSRHLTNLKKKPFENIVGKGEISRNHHFSLLLQCFLFFPKQSSISESHLFCCLQSLSNGWSKIFLFGKEP